MSKANFNNENTRKVIVHAEVELGRDLDCHWLKISWTFNTQWGKQAASTIRNLLTWIETWRSCSIPCSNRMRRTVDHISCITLQDQSISSMDLANGGKIWNLWASHEYGEDDLFPLSNSNSSTLWTLMSRILEMVAVAIEDLAVWTLPGYTGRCKVDYLLHGSSKHMHPRRDVGWKGLFLTVLWKLSTFQIYPSNSENFSPLNGA